MFDDLRDGASFDEVYAEKRELRGEQWLDRMGVAVTGGIARKLRANPVRIKSIVGRVATFEGKFRGLDEAQLRVHAVELKRLLRREGLRDELVAEAFALVRETAGLILGMRHFDVQLIGGWILLNGMIAEMNTGEGKTLTATLPACTAALAGIPVHVITVNDYLVERDCELMRRVYETLGVSVAAATSEMDQKARQAAYTHDIVYCTNKTLVFDYLRDRILLATGSSSLHLRLEKIYGADTRSRRLLLRGLHFAIVDEADSVLVDEARTPLIISAEVPSADEALVAEQALGLARQLEPGEHYVIVKAERRIALTEAGHTHMVALCKALGGVWAGALRREELVTQALTALHLFARDDHYLVRDGKIQVIDEHTGRVMADRSWGQGLHQLIESKEGCEITPRKEPLARISYQRFFRRYLRLAGMTVPAPRSPVNSARSTACRWCGCPPTGRAGAFTARTVFFRQKAKNGRPSSIVSQSCMHMAFRCCWGRVLLRRRKWPVECLPSAALSTLCSTPNRTRRRRRSLHVPARLAASPSPPTWPGGARTYRSIRRCPVWAACM